MNNIDRFKKIVNTKINYIKPIKLEELSKNFKNSDKFPDIKSSFEFPPKSIELVLQIFFDKQYKELNFFDIARLLQQFEQELLIFEIVNKSLFTELLQDLFDDSKKYIQNIILKIVTKILINRQEHTFYNELYKNMISKEFVLSKLCMKKDFYKIEKMICNKSLEQEIRDLNLHKIFYDITYKYGDFLITKLSNDTINESNFEAYNNNILLDNNLDFLYNQLDKILSYIEFNQNTKNNKYLDFIISNKLGNIDSQNSNWFNLCIPIKLINRYKKLKGLFEFQKFVDIAEYLSDNSDLKHSNLSEDMKTSDATRILNRSAFWSNYDEKFESVEMWISNDDYQILENSPINLDKIKRLSEINNEMCVFYFENMIIINFFRRDNILKNFKYKNDNNRKRLDTLVFVGLNKDKVKDILQQSNNYNFELNNKIHDLANFIIKYEVFLWQGWVDKFLREFDIYPNNSVLNGRKFISAKNPLIEDKYDKNFGLERARQKALQADKPSKYEDVIKILNYIKFETPFD